MPGMSRAGSKSGPAEVRTATSQPSFCAVRAVYEAEPPNTSPPSRRSHETWPTARKRGRSAPPCFGKQLELVLRSRDGHGVTARETGGAVAGAVGIAHRGQQTLVREV